MNFFSGFLAGLLNSFYCAGVCLPPVFAFSVLKFSESRRQFYLGILDFFLGRLSGYLLIAVVCGYTGILLESIHWKKIVAIVQMLVAILIVLAVFNRNVFSHSKLFLPFNYAGSLFLLGLALGVNICPPFVLAISEGLLFKGIFPTIIYFLGFYFGSSAWLVILLLSPSLAKNQRFRSALNIFLLLLGGYYFLVGLFQFLK